MSGRPRAVVLLSGGVDSSTALAVAVSRGFEVFALTFRYGQRHELEVDAAKAIAREFGVSDHVIAHIDLRLFGGSALTANIDVPRDRSMETIAKGIPITYVPARNTIFLAFAMAWAETLGAEDLFIGVNALDYSGYPDCRPEFIEAFQRMANLATKSGVEGNSRLAIQTPLIQLSKAEIITLGMQLGVDFGKTLTCYDPSPHAVACGRCDACALRLKGFSEAGLVDPAPYTADVR